MGHQGYGSNFTNEYGYGFDLEDILREYREQNAPPISSATATAVRQPESYSRDTSFHASDEDMKVYNPRSSISQMEEEARRTVSSLGNWSESFSAPPEGSGLDMDAEQLYHIRTPKHKAVPPEEIADADSGLSADEALAASYRRERAKENRSVLSRLSSEKKGKKGKAGVKEKLSSEPVEKDYGEDLAAGFTDYSVSPGGYAPDLDYEAEEPARQEESEPQRPAGFKNLLLSLTTGLMLRIRPNVTEATDTVEDVEEDLGPELSAKDASKYYGSHIHTLRMRFKIALVLLVIMLYISLGLPVPGMLKSVHVAAAMCLALQFTILLLSLDIVAGAMVNLSRRRFGADALAVLACVTTSIDAIGVATDSFGSLHMPLCALSSLSMTGLLLSSFLNARGMRKALRVPAIGKKTFAVTGEYGVLGKELTLLKTPRPAAGFVRRAEESAPDEILFNRISLILLPAAFLLALIAALVSHSSDDFIYIFSAFLVPAVPVTALLCFSLPFFVGSMRIFSDGAAIAGWSGLCEVGQSKNLIVTDQDLFPSDSVELSGIRIFADESAHKVISYAGTLITASGSSLTPCFAELMEKHNCDMCHVENFEFLAGGGMKGVINGETVLCGGTDLMRLMNVRIPFRLVDKTTVLLAIDGILYGIFSMNYQPNPKIRRALLRLMRSNRHPVFAIRDFIVTPEMIHNSFDVATDGYDFPPYVDRFSISEAKPSSGSKIAAVVCREDLSTMVSMADTGRSMYVATRINILLMLLSIVIGLAAVFIKVAAGGSFGVGVGFLLAYALVWALPVAALSLFLRF